jgi:hypothetical protein
MRFAQVGPLGMPTPADHANFSSQRIFGGREHGIPKNEAASSSPNFGNLGSLLLYPTLIRSPIRPAR